MKRLNRNSKGFTLIEVIVSLVLVGIMAVVAGMGIVQAAKAFVFTQEATMLSQKGDLAMSRLRRSVQNLTMIVGTPSNSSLVVKRLNKGIPVTESYSLSSSVLQLNYNNNGAQTLTNSVQSFALTYSHTNGTAWTPSMGIDKLATVNVSMSLAGPGGAVVTYVDKIMPRNTYTPKSAFNPSGAGSGSYNCFVATVAYGSGDYPSVRVLRQFRDQILTKYSVGKAFIKWYYKVGPGLADSFKSSNIWRAVIRIILLPFVGMAFLILYFPAGIPLMILMAWLLARLFTKADMMQSIYQKRLYGLYGKSSKGSILIGLIITMVIMASLGGAMVSMFSASNIASIPAYFSQSAYYLAESGRNYAAKMFLANKDSDQNFINALYSNGASKTFPVGTGNFQVKVKMFYFGCAAGTNITTMSVSKWGDFPDNWRPSNLSGKQGWLQIPTGTSTTEIRRFTSVTNTGTLDFMLESAVSPVAGRVMPVVRLNGAKTVIAKNVGDSAGDNLTINIGNINTGGVFMLPAVNGTISFVDASNKTWSIIYDFLDINDPSNVKMTGIRNFPGKSLPTAGLSLTDGTSLVLGRYAQFTSKGTMGIGSMAVSQTITQNQPLDVVKLYTVENGSLDPNNFTAQLGTNAVVNVDGANAMKITGTESTYFYAGTNNATALMQESFQTVSWGANNPLAAIWAQSNKILSYDLQAKIKFTETEDDDPTDGSAPINHPGNYMPGITFRVKCTTGTSNKDCTYYTVSLMRGIQGVISSGGGSCGGSRTYTDNDDISDSLFAQFSAHSTSVRPKASDILCTGADKFVPSTWNSQNPSSYPSTVDSSITLSGGAALDGIPYIVFTQKDWSRTAGTCGGANNPWDWLAFMPLVEAKVQKIYHYKKTTGTNGRPEGWYEGTISGDPRSGSNIEGPYTIWKLKDKYGVLKTSTIGGVQVLGVPGEITILDPTTASAASAGSPVSKWTGADTVTTPVGFIIPHLNDGTYSYSGDNYIALKAVRNYRIYPKPWITLAARVMELEGNFDCNSATGDANGNEWINAVMAYVSSTDGVAGTYGASTKDAIRKFYARNPDHPDITNYTVQWPDIDDYFTMSVWDNGNYSSKTVTTSAANCGWVSVPVKIVEKGKDADGQNVVAYTSFLTTEASNYFTGYDTPEFGYHTSGISAVSGCSGTHCETAYFTDGYWRAYKGGLTGLIPGIQEQ